MSLSVFFVCRNRGGTQVIGEGHRFFGLSLVLLSVQVRVEGEGEGTLTSAEGRREDRHRGSTELLIEIGRCTERRGFFFFVPWCRWSFSTLSPWETWTVSPKL
ncbi:hypothetical protein KP509_01G014000 [Ceratopteris richardii]|uniref:Uncharacterized protein n=1 Tax=Ceratopteris richardii TaxID=49495 RepID=A0A8T2VM60_CERRI|nr:hypothetical protein KP509_01G014000 [Ceratopteris richardii]